MARTILGPVTTTGIDPTVPPSGTGCAECGHVGCCDSSPAQHATAHFRETGHPVIASFEPGEEWFWDYAREKGVLGEPLAPPRSHPDDQPAPGPEGRVPADWQDHVH